MKPLKKMLAALVLLFAVTATASAETITLSNLSNVYVDGINYGQVEDVLANCPEYDALLRVATIDWLNANLPFETTTHELGVAWVQRVQNAGITVPPETIALIPPEE